MRAKLEDETTPLSSPPHLSLFEDFAAGAGDKGVIPPGNAMSEPVCLYTSHAWSDPSFTLAALWPYEAQAGEVAAAKAKSLRAHYGLASETTAFWDLHALREDDHAKWNGKTLTLLKIEEESVSMAAWMACDAWWAFLDERERLPSEEGCLRVVADGDSCSVGYLPDFSKAGKS